MKENQIFMVVVKVSENGIKVEKLDRKNISFLDIFYCFSILL